MFQLPLYRVINKYSRVTIMKHPQLWNTQYSNWKFSGSNIDFKANINFIWSLNQNNYSPSLPPIFKICPTCPPFSYFTTIATHLKYMCFQTVFSLFTHNFEFCMEKQENLKHNEQYFTIQILHISTRVLSLWKIYDF
jgi:hypothetical protein